MMRIGTRGSALALWQARAVARGLTEHGEPAPEIVVIRTSGDDIHGLHGLHGLHGSHDIGPPDPPRAAPGDAGTSPENIKRAFVKEIEEALLDGRIDLAVHSAKDLPAVLPDGLRIAGALAREDPHDALVLPASITVRALDAALAAMGESPRVGTSSVRRAAEFRRLRPGAQLLPIRGNVDTRLRKLDGGECDALLLAAAGLRRLGLETRISALLPLDIMIPAPGQGIIAIECAATLRPERLASVSAITDPDAVTALLAERALVRALGGGCQMPLGALATVEGQTVTLHAAVATADGRRSIRFALQGRRGNPAAIGEKVAAQLIARGAAEILSPK